jgi:transcriptional regulator
MPRFAELSFFTDREKEIYRLRQQLDSQKRVAERLKVGDSAVASALKSIRLKVLKLMNSLEESLDMGLIAQEDLAEYLDTQTLIEKVTEQIKEGNQVVITSLREQLK